MPKTITIQAFTFQELSERAKDAVRSWLQESDYDWWDVIYEDFVIVAKCFGFEVNTHERYTTKKLSHPIYDSDIWFDSRYGYTAGFNAQWYLLDATHATKKLAEHLDDELLQRMAVVLEAEIAKFAIEGLEPIMREGNVVVKIVGDEHGVKDGCDSCEWSSEYELTEEQQAAAGSLGITVEATAKDLAKWLAKQLESEADYRASDEAITELCDANEYLFDEDGRVVS